MYRPETNKKRCAGCFLFQFLHACWNKRSIQVVWVCMHEANMCSSYLETDEGAVTVVAFSKAPCDGAFYMLPPDKVNLQHVKSNELTQYDTQYVVLLCVCASLTSINGHRVACF